MTHTQKTAIRRPPGVSTPVPATHDTELVDDLDALLDEIDSVLEQNALEVTRAYKQRGGE